MTTKYFGVPFANTGDKTSIPDASQPSGSVSFEDGWTPDYAKDQATDPNAKDIPRQSENYFKFTVTEALKEIQEVGAKPYDPVVNYPVGAIIPGSDNNLYKCFIANGPATSVVDPVGDLTGTWETEASQIMIIKDEKSAGTNGGTFTAGDWRTRDLNVVNFNTIPGASISSNQITLPAGDYIVRGSCPASLTNAHKTKVRDTTGVADLVIGTSEHADSAQNSRTRSFFIGKFSLGIESLIEIQHRCGTTRSGDGFGIGSGFGVVEVYTEVEICKL